LIREGDNRGKQTMAGFGDAIKYLYQEFMLQDILSFVTLGAIITLTE